MTRPDPRTVLLVFDSANAVLWAEEIADDVGVPVEVVPAPAESRAKCDLALLTTLARAPELQEALTAEGVPFRPWT
ncbi:MAG TPA: DUF3343 domain-containing protein [Longimicrobiales bacterium]|nr:DUF3343 domain-containing protein [Longimicrobiales bacterium]